MLPELPAPPDPLPAEPPEEPEQTPLPHVPPNRVQSWQAAAFMPQAVSTVPETHVPFTSQHPAHAGVQGPASSAGPVPPAASSAPAEPADDDPEPEPVRDVLSSADPDAAPDAPEDPNPDPDEGEGVPEEVPDENVAELTSGPADPLHPAEATVASTGEISAIAARPAFEVRMSVP